MRPCRIELVVLLNDRGDSVEEHVVELQEVDQRLEIRKLLMEAVTELPMIYREVFMLREIEELSISESAQALSISVASVKVRLHRARIMLQTRLAPQLRRLAPKRRRFPW